MGTGEIIKMELGNIGLWENLITVFGDIRFFMVVLTMLFAWYAIKYDVGKWGLIGFAVIFILWAASMIDVIFVYIAVITIAVVIYLVIKRYIN
jgi:hypothetical protein